MTASQSGVFNLQQFSDIGGPLVAGRLYTYASGTTTQKTVYTDASGLVPHTYTSDGSGGLYIALNSRGELPAPVYLTGGAYDFALKRADGSTVWTRNAEGMATSLFYPSGIGAVPCPLQEKMLEFPSVRDFYSPSDGADYSPAFRRALDHNALTGVKIFVPAGVYNLLTWTTYSASYVVFEGSGFETTRIIGPTTVGVHFVKMSGGVCDLEGISFEKFDQVVYSDAAYSILRVHRCKGYRNRSNFARAADVTDFPLSKINRIMLTENYIEKSGGFQLHGACDSAIASLNQGVNIGRDSSVWSGNLYQTFFISIGDTDNNNSSVAQELTKNVSITGNVAVGMYNTTPDGTFNTTNAIQVSAINATLTGNAISGMDAADRGNNEAIYCKAQSYVIQANAISGSKTNSTCIAIKGSLTNSGPMQRKSIVSQNTIRSTDGLCSNGITMFNGTFCDISENQIDGMSLDSVKVFGDPYGVNVMNNSISNNSGTSAIVFATGSISNCKVTGNTIDGMTATTGNMRPIIITSNPRQLSKITVTAGGSGYTSTPTVTISGGGGSGTAQATISGGVVIGIQVNGSDTAFTSVPTVSITGGGGSGASATAIISTGAINNLFIGDNTVYWSPVNTLSSACGVFIQSDSAASSSSGNIQIKNTNLIADSSASAASIQGINLFSPTAGWARDVFINDLNMEVPDITKCRPVNFNSSSDIPSQGSNYTSFDINGVSVNGMRKRILSRFNLDEKGFTAVVPLSGLAVGSIFIGNIPYSVLTMHALAFTAAVPTSGTSSATIGISIGGSGQFNVLAATSVKSFAANSFKACIPDGTATNAKRSFVSSGLVPVYLEVGIEALTGGRITIVAQTEQIA